MIYPVLMAEDRPSLQIDDDWKKQAQEEKRRLAEREQKAAPAPATAPPPGAGAAPAGVEPPAPAGAGGAPRGRTAAGRRGREVPVASFTTLVNSIVTQVLLYLGELAPAGSEPMLNLDMAKHQLDTLGVLEDKTRNNLTEEEQRALDSALYEGRMRYVNVASQYL